jgi:hypothetical protein
MQSLSQYWDSPRKQRDATIALNNIGVTLLQRRFYNDALMAFDDALGIMKSILEREFPNLLTMMPHSCLEQVKSCAGPTLVNRSLLFASKNLSKSITSACSSTRNEEDGTLRIVTADKSSESIEELISECPNALYGYLVRIDEVDYEYEEIGLDFYETLMEISMLLGNIGTLFRCVVREQTIKQSSRKCPTFVRIAQDGQMWCQDAYSILLYLSSMADMINDDCLQRRVCCMKIYILQNLMLLTADVQDIDQSRQYYNLLGDIRFEIKNNDFYYYSTNNALQPFARQRTAARAA